MRYDVAAVWGPMQSELLRRQNEIERQALGNIDIARMPPAIF